MLPQQRWSLKTLGTSLLTTEPLYLPLPVFAITGLLNVQKTGCWQ